MMRLTTAAVASLLALALTGCGENDNKPVEPVTTVTTPAPAEVTAPSVQKPVEQTVEEQNTVEQKVEEQKAEEQKAVEEHH